ncbi:MAG TPA: sulfite exporter TauE/SafE family protein [Ilumatobacteraceae bacterium]|nr:sulfite exporter TauE/SafE family protein [Ilumatobacteraceae bacterium]HRB03891.1 sulfite exporter TauE/SafE family protein [Ilumatobacteraceae bacterium]
MTLVWAACIGVGIGFLGGLLGKGGSAIATPLLAAIGVPPIIAVASPLPATIPSTMIASYAYARERLVDWRVVRWSVGFGIPATAIGALLTRWIDGGVLVRVTDVILIGLGLRLLLTSAKRPSPGDEPHVVTAWQLMAVATTVGFISGLLANSGGFLLAPLFITVLKLPIKSALACSLAVASVLAVPGTIVHASLGHIDWTLVAVFAATSVPLSFLGARVAMRTDAHRLERLYGAALIVLGTVFLIIS